MAGDDTKSANLSAAYRMRQFNSTLVFVTL